MSGPRLQAYRAPGPMLNPDRSRLNTFASLRTGRSFLRGFVCTNIVLADMRTTRRRVLARPFVACHPSTAKRHGWKVLLTPVQARWGRGA